MAGNRMAGVQDGRARIARQRTSARGDTGGRPTSTGMPGSPISRAGLADRRGAASLGSRVNARQDARAGASRARMEGR